MEELLACVYLIEEGLESETLYENKLNELFAATPYCDDLFKLELLSDNIKESIVYIKTHIDYSALAVSAAVDSQKVWICFLSGSEEMLDIFVLGTLSDFLSDCDDWDFISSNILLVNEEMSSVFIS